MRQYVCLRFWLIKIENEIRRHTQYTYTCASTICMCAACDHFMQTTNRLREKKEEEEKQLNIFIRISTRKAIKDLTIIEPSNRFDSFNFSIFGCEKSQTHSHFLLNDS